MTPNAILGLSAAFTYAVRYGSPAASVTDLALRLVRADMGHPAVVRGLPPAFAHIVDCARSWLREAQEVIQGERPRTYPIH